MGVRRNPVPVPRHAGERQGHHHESVVHAAQSSQPEGSSGMSFLIHRCACGHIDLFHGSSRGGPCEMKTCRCQSIDQGESWVLPTWNNGQLVESIAEPGSKPPAYTGLQL